MLLLKFMFPGDPITPILLLFGADFSKIRRQSGGGKIVITTATEEAVIPIDDEDIVCDSCNDAIVQHDPCCSVDDSRLYCWDCAKKWVIPYIVEEAR